MNENQETKSTAADARHSSPTPGSALHTVHIHTTPPRALEDRHGYTKHGHGRHYIAVGEDFDPYNKTLDRAWDRRCDASRWAKRAGAKVVEHWYQF